MDIVRLATMNKTIGAKETLKAIEKGALKYVFLGRDGDNRITDPLRTACEVNNVPLNDKHSMDELGRACRVKVRTAAVGILR